MRKRRGYSLVECLIAIALIGATMTVVGVAMSGMHRACQRVREEAAIEMELQRFAVQLRADAHLAVSAEQEDAADENTPTGTLLLTFHDEESVRYTLQTRYIQRVQRRGDELLHRETYRLPDAVTARWELEEKGSARMVSLKLDPDPGELSDLMGNQTSQINAAVGLLRPLPAQTES